MQDDELSFHPVFSLPSNALTFAFKRQLGPSDKLRLGHLLESSPFISPLLLLLSHSFLLILGVGYRKKEL